MYFTKIDDEDYAIKPMNCPGGMLVYKTKPHSYKELPIRPANWAWYIATSYPEPCTVLFRVRCFTQDDAHIFMMPSQIRSEIKNVIRLFDEVYATFGLLPRRTVHPSGKFHG
jgi:threonyl-tRNA synthetase